MIAVYHVATVRLQLHTMIAKGLDKSSDYLLVSITFNILAMTPGDTPMSTDVDAQASTPVSIRSGLRPDAR